MRTRIGLVLTLCALLTATILPSGGCASTQTHVSPVADIANAGGKVEESAHAILVAVQQANQTVVNGKPEVSRNVLDQVAIAVNKIGHAGIALNTGLSAYTAAKAAGSDLVAIRAAIQQAIQAVIEGLADIGKVLPSGTLQTVDSLVATIVGSIAQIRGTVGL